MKKLLIGVLVCLTLTGCGKEEVVKEQVIEKETKVECVVENEEIEEQIPEKKPGIEYTVENLEENMDYELLKILGELGPRETEEEKVSYQGIIDFIDITLHENEGKIREPLLEYAIEYREACVDLMNAKDIIEIRGILTEMEYRALDYEYSK